VLTHVRCHARDVDLALSCGVQGINLLFGTSPLLRAHSHGRRLTEIVKEAAQVIAPLLGRGLEVRFSCEDAFRTRLRDLLTVYRAIDALGVQRVGVADTVGRATPTQVVDVVGAVRAAVSCDIEFHGHDDGGCAVANAAAALEAGATHVSTTVLGLGERTGIASLSGVVARVWMDDPALLAAYRLDRLPELDRLVSRLSGVPVPFNAPITGRHAFTHKAGLHTKAVLRDPRTYEALDPAAFGREREVLVAHHLCGRHGIAHRAAALGLALDEAALAAVTREVKALADEGQVNDGDVDALLRRRATEVTAS
jgi:homocitrate synthase